MKRLLLIFILTFSLQSFTKADDSTEYITKKKQTNYITKEKKTPYITKKKQTIYITKKPKYITKKEIKKTNYKFLLLFPFGFFII